MSKGAVHNMELVHHAGRLLRLGQGRKTAAFRSNIRDAGQMKRSPLHHVSIHHVSIHGHAVGYRRMGPTHQTDDTQTILLIHGLAGSSKTWDAVMPVLAEQFDVIAPDLLGHGESAEPVGDYSLGAFASGLRDLLAVVDVQTVTIVGHSLRWRCGDAACLPTPGAA